jgi:flagellin-specific chaperone FliS
VGLAQSRDNSSTQTLVGKAADYYRRAQAALKQGDWSGYGENIKRLGEVLNELQEKSK